MLCVCLCVHVRVCGLLLTPIICKHSGSTFVQHNKLCDITAEINVIILLSSHPFNLLVVRYLLLDQLANVKMMPEWISMLVVFGGGGKVPSLIQGFFTQTHRATTMFKYHLV